MAATQTPGGRRRRNLAHVLDLLERDPMDCAELLDGRPSCGCWKFPAAGDLSWSVRPGWHLVDLQYSDVRLDKGLYNRWSRAGR